VKRGRAPRADPAGSAPQDGNPLPESIALVLWGTDNLKTEGGPIAQALALIGAGRGSTATAASAARS
jgi:magnesium chelatase subunit H